MEGKRLSDRASGLNVARVRMSSEIRDRIRATGAKLDFMLTRMSNHLGHQLRGIASPSRVHRRFDMGDHPNAAGFDVIGDRLALGRVELVAVEMGIVAELAHGSLAEVSAAV